jgi:hypothetical protein
MKGCGVLDEVIELSAPVIGLADNCPSLKGEYHIISHQQIQSNPIQ